MHKPLLSVALAGLGSLVASTTLAGSGPLLVSGPSPYAGCTYGGEAGTLFPNAEVEPSIAVHGSNIVVAWQQDRWSNGGAHGLASAYSNNGGAAFKETTLPADLCAPGGLNYERASDPWLDTGPDGIVYASLLPFTISDNHNGVASAVSYDGGKTWTHAQNVVEYPSGDLQHATDKNAVTADPNRPKTAYMVWDLLIDPQNNSVDDLHRNAYSGPGYFSKTTDGGVTWSTPKVIFPTDNRTQTIGNHIVVGPDGTLYDFANWIVKPNTLQNGETDQLGMVKSTDGGATWSAPVAIRKMDDISPVTDPNTGAAIRTGDIIPESAIDPVTGTLYLIWMDADFSDGKYDEIALISSSDGGATWTNPVRVSTPTGRPAFTAQVAAYAGQVGITYYDFRNLAAGNPTTLPTDFWGRASSDGGVSFGPDIHLAGSFDMLSAPYARGYFVGDYTGLAADASGFTSVFVAANSGDKANPTDVFVVKF